MILLTFVEPTGIEPVILMCKTSVFPLALRPHLVTREFAF